MLAKQSQKPKDERSSNMKEHEILFCLADLLAQQQLINPDEKAKLTELIRKEVN